MKLRKALSLRSRLALGAGSLAALAILGAALLIYGITESARRVDEAVGAQHRMELLSTMSARVGDYAVVAVEATTKGSRSRDQQVDLLRRRAELVTETFQRLDSAYGKSVLDAREEMEPEQMRRATRSLGLARMRAQFQRLARTLSDQDGIDPPRLRAALDAFATQFSPLLDQAIAAERRDRDASFASAELFRRRMTWIAWGVAGLALALLLIFQLGLVRPLMLRIGKIATVANQIGTGEQGARLQIERRDELGLLFANVNRMGARLDRRRAAVDADRRALNAIIDERTEALRAANTQLELADTQRRRFFADVSHELRTPLTVILGEADLGMRAPELGPEQARESMALIHTRAKRLNRRIDDLLRVARSESGEIELASEPFSIADAAAEAIEDLAALAKRRRIAIAHHCPTGLLARGDRDWTRQVISGLLDNAIRHSPESSQIDVTADSEDGMVRLSVRDEGSGVSANEQASVFTRFARGAQEEKRSGFGVGLSLAKWIVERQSGRITLSSPRPGADRGTDVTIWLPRALEDETA